MIGPCPVCNQSGGDTTGHHLDLCACGHMRYQHDQHLRACYDVDTPTPCPCPSWQTPAARRSA